MRNNAAGHGTVQSVRRALDVLTRFTPLRSEASLADLAREVDLPKSVVHRLLRTLVEAGFVEQDATSRHYRLGPQAFAIGAAYPLRRKLETAARPVLDDIVGWCGHACSVGVRDHDTVLYVLFAESTRAIRVTPPDGTRRPLHATSSGKILLASFPDETVRQILGKDRLPALTDRTITETDRLLAELVEVRERGYAVNDGESVEGLLAIAVPLRDERGATIASLSVRAPAYLISATERVALIERLIRAGRDVSHRLGAGNLNQRTNGDA